MPPKKDVPVKKPAGPSISKPAAKPTAGTPPAKTKAEPAAPQTPAKTQEPPVDLSKVVVSASKVGIWKGWLTDAIQSGGLGSMCVCGGGVVGNE